MDISTNAIDHFGIIAGIFDELGISEVIDPALPKTRHHKASHSAMIKAMVLNGLGFIESRLKTYPYREAIFVEDLWKTGICIMR